MKTPDLPPRGSLENKEEYPISANLQFALSYAVSAGHYIKNRRNNLIKTKKLDRTDVTDVDIAVNKDFEQKVAVLSEGRASVTGEESSHKVAGSEEEWIIDPVDGTGEYIDDSLLDHERTSCVAIALFKDGEPQLSVVYNPFRDELFYADKELGGAFLNGERLDLSRAEDQYLALSPGVPYDFCHWDGAITDARFFEDMLERPPLGSYSAIYQACAVAKGESAFAVFPGSTVHDIAPADLLVRLAGGVSTRVDGRPHDRNNLNGAVYSSNYTIHDDVVRALSAA
ncbi:MAG: inositol monophosphatase family protein [Candidatus Saccharimonadales bacterium]